MADVVKVQIEAQLAQYQAGMRLGESVTQQFGDTVRNVAEKSAAATAASEAAMRSQFLDTQATFTASKNQQILVEQAWSRALIENAERAQEAANMAAASVEEEAGRIEAAKRQEERAYERTMERMREFEILTSKALRSGSIGGVIGVSGEMAGIAAAAAVLEHYIEKVKELAIETKHLSEMGGLNVKELAATEAAFKANAVPTEGLRVSMLRYSGAVEGAAEGNEKAQKAFKQLHVTSTNYITMLQQVATHLQHSTEIDKDNTAVKELMGKQAARMIGFLRDEGDALGGVIAGYGEFGQKMQDAVKPAVELEKTEQHFQQEMLKMAAETLPAVNFALKAFTTAWIVLKEVISEIIDIVLTLSVTIAKAFSSMANVMRLNFAGAKADFRDMKEVFSKGLKDSQEDWLKMSKTIKDVWAVAPVHSGEGGSEGKGNVKFGIGEKKTKEIQEEILKGEEKHIDASIQLEEKRIEVLENLGMAQRNAVIDMLESLLEFKVQIEKEYVKKRQALYADDPVKLENLRNEELAIEDKSIAAKQALYLKYVTKNLQTLSTMSKDHEKWAEGMVQSEDKARERGLIERLKLLEKAIKESDKQAEYDLININKVLVADTDAQIKRLEAHQKLALESAKDLGYKKQVEIIKSYDAAIKELLKDLNKLSVDKVHAEALKSGVDPKFGVAAAQQEGFGKLAAQDEKTQEEIRKRLEKTKQEFEKVALKISSSFANAFESVLLGTARIGAAFTKLGADLIKEVIKFLAEKAAKFAAAEALELVFHTKAKAAQAAIDAASASSSAVIGGTARVAEVEGLAAVAAAAAFASTAAIPFIGLALAPAAASAAFAAVSSLAPLAAFEQGGISDIDQLAVLHKREMVLPASLSDGIQRMIGSGGARSGNGTTQVNIGVSAVDGQSTANFFHNNSHQINKQITRAVRQGRLAVN